MKPSFLTGASFGLTSGTITTLGLMVGLHAGTHSRIAVLGGIFTIAIADAFSDALGIHVSQESQSRFSGKSVWESTIATFFSKFLFTIPFAAPIILLPLNQAIIISVAWGLVVLGIFSYIIGKAKKNPWQVVFEHIFIALLVVFITHYAGDMMSKIFAT